MPVAYSAADAAPRLHILCEFAHACCAFLMCTSTPAHRSHHVRGSNRSDGGAAIDGSPLHGWIGPRRSRAAKARLRGDRDPAAQGHQDPRQVPAEDRLACPQVTSGHPIRGDHRAEGRPSPVGSRQDDDGVTARTVSAPSGHSPPDDDLPRRDPSPTIFPELGSSHLCDGRAQRHAGFLQ